MEDRDRMSLGEWLLQLAVVAAAAWATGFVIYLAVELAKRGWFG